jgi:hypothetical protein
MDCVFDCLISDLINISSDDEQRSILRIADQHRQRILWPKYVSFQKEHDTVQFPIRVLTNNYIADIWETNAQSGSSKFGGGQYGGQTGQSSASFGGGQMGGSQSSFSYSNTNSGSAYGTSQGSGAHYGSGQASGAHYGSGQVSGGQYGTGGQMSGGHYSTSQSSGGQYGMGQSSNGQFGSGQVSGSSYNKNSASYGEGLTVEEQEEIRKKLAAAAMSPGFQGQGFVNGGQVVRQKNRTIVYDNNGNIISQTETSTEYGSLGREGEAGSSFSM